MISRAFNFLWLNLDLPAPPDPEDGSIRQPLPEKYIENLRDAGKRYPKTDVILWVDSQRLTEKQMAYLKDKAETGMDNVHIKDLRSIPAYDQNNLYNKGETNPKWRYSQSSLIWRQVDCAKILVCLQGKYDQVFFSDLDHAHLGLDSPPVKKMLKRHGIMVGSSCNMYHNIENQLWGFTERRRDFFEDYYKAALLCADRGQNAWYELVDRVEALRNAEQLKIEDICHLIKDDETEAEHPDHLFRKGDGKEYKPELIADPLSGNFHSASIKGTAPPASMKTPPTVILKGKPS